MNDENIYRILLKAYPSRYRREFGEAMAQCFRDQLRAANTVGERIRLWFRTIGDLALTVPVQHGERLLGGLRGGLLNYSEPARRAMFFARYEAGSFSGLEIGLDHLLLGVLREDHKLANAVLGSDGAREIVRAIEAQQTNPRRRPTANRLHIPLSLDCKTALERAGQLARDSGTKVASRHFLSAILAHETSKTAALLRSFIRNGEF